MPQSFSRDLSFLENVWSCPAIECGGDDIEALKIWWATGEQAKQSNLRRDVRFDGGSIGEGSARTERVRASGHTVVT